MERRYIGGKHAAYLSTASHRPSKMATWFCWQMMPLSEVISDALCPPQICWILSYCEAGSLIVKHSMDQIVQSP